MSIRNTIKATAIMAAAAALGGVNVYHQQCHCGGKESRMFDLRSIMHERKRNQRNKNQKRIRGKR